MNIKAIIASLVLGSSSVALASPSVTVSATAQGSYGTTVVRDHRIDDNCNDPAVSFPTSRPIYYGDNHDHGDGRRVFRGERMPPVYRPVTLASGLHFAGDGRKFITVGSEAGRFETLQISAANGRTFIKQVYVQFENGQEQVIRNLDRTLVGHDTLTLDLDGNRRAIRRIVVYGNDITMGRRFSTGAFTVSAA